MAYLAVPSVPPPPNIPASPLPASLTTLAFTNGTPFQTDWRGVNANYMGRAALPEYALDAATLTTEWDRVALSGVKTVSTEYLESWAMPSYPSGSPDWTSANMAGFYTFLGAMQTRGVNVNIKMGWHWPQNVGALTGAAPITPTPANEVTFAAWVSESLNQMINVRGYTNITGIQFFTEPSTSTIGSIPVGYTSVDYYAHIITVVRAKIISDDASRVPIRTRISLIGPQEFSYTHGDWTEYLNDNYPGLIDEYREHSYCNVPTFAPFGFVATNCSTYQTWIDQFVTWVADADPYPFSSDECGFLTGGDTDSTGYRKTADAGWQLCRLVDGHMQSGAVSSYIWLLEDQPVLGGGNLEYGVMYWIATAGNTVKPAWYAFSLHANLTGGGGGTKLYSCTGGSSTLHGTAAWIPLGVRNATNTGGEWTFVVINESTAAPVKIALASPLTTGRTFYRYTYSGETPPTAAVNPAYLLSWDRKFLNVTDVIPTNTAAGHSVTFYSTINLSASAVENLALNACSVETDSVGFGSPGNLISGNFSNVIAAGNSWRKANDSSHYVQINWTNITQLARLEIAFAGTTTGAVYATYADTTSPTVLADYGIQYLNAAGSWTDFSTPISVTGNTSVNKTHTFTSVSARAIRLTVTSAAASANVNQIGVYAS